jgi:PAS domain S-box-containing protein
MAIDIRTIVLMLGIVHLLQFAVLYSQYRLNKVYKGIGWWLLWTVAEVIGFGFFLLREAIPFLHAVIFIQNTAIILGTIFLYIGCVRFLDQKENLKIIVPVLTLFFLSFLFFIFVYDDINIRSILINLTLAFISFLTASNLYIYRVKSIRNLINFNIIVFLMHGCVLMFGVYQLTSGSNIEDVFAPTLINTLPLIDALIVSLLWTFGLILMVNQRLGFDVTQSKEHFEKVFNTSPDAALITQLSDGYIIDCNQGFTSLTGFTHEESIGNSVLAMNIWVNPKDRQKVIMDVAQKGYCENFESEFYTKSGRKTVGLMSAKLITLGNTPCLISITRDITARKIADDIIRESEEKYRLLTETTPDLVILHDIKGIVKYINKAGIALIGIKEDEIFGKSLVGFLPSDELPSLVERQKSRCEGDLSTFTYETKFIDKNNEEIFFEVSSSPIVKDGQIENILIVARDIRERKKAEAVNLVLSNEIQMDIIVKQKLIEELTVAKEKAEDMNKIKSYFFANMNHELRTPFVSILGYAQLLDESLTDPNSLVMVGNIINSAERLTETLNKILNLSRVEFKEIIVKKENVNINQIFLEVYTTFLKSAILKNLSFSIVELPENVPVSTDAQLFHEIIYNLISNAIKYTEKGSVELSLALQKESGSYTIILIIKDTGIGIPEEKQEQVWLAFRQVSEGFGRSSEGTGLGLTITKKYVELLGGKIFLKSEIGEGSTFVVELPLSGEVQSIAENKINRE